MTTMHENFASWYAHVDLGDSPERLEKRWMGIDALLGVLEYTNVSELLEVVLKRPNGAEGPGSTLIRKHLTKADPTFPVQGNDAEMSLLAEVSLAISMDKLVKNLLAGQVATAVYCAFAGGAVRSDSATNLLNRSKGCIEKQGKLSRERKTLREITRAKAPKMNFDQFLIDGQNYGDPATIREAMKGVSDAITQAISAAARVAKSERSILESQIKIQDEELDLLWWSLNGISDANGERFSSMKKSDRPLIASGEAAKRTQFEPGPSAVMGLLGTVGLKASKKLTIPDAVNAAELAWLRDAVRDGVSAITPLHFAITKRLEAPTVDTWVGHWAAVTGIKDGHKFSETELAYLFYQECLVLEKFGAIDE